MKRYPILRAFVHSLLAMIPIAVCCEILLPSGVSRAIDELIGCVMLTGMCVCVSSAAWKEMKRKQGAALKGLFVGMTALTALCGVAVIKSLANVFMN